MSYGAVACISPAACERLHEAPRCHGNVHVGLVSRGHSSSSAWRHLRPRFLGVTAPNVVTDRGRPHCPSRCTVRFLHNLH